MSILIFLSLLSILLTTIYLYVKYIFSYWKRRGVPFIEPSIPFGNLGPFFWRTRSFGQNLDDLYKSSTDAVLGFYMALRPALLIRDPKITKDILIKDFQYFRNRGYNYDLNHNKLAANLFASDENWKEMRAKLSPAFTSGKLKGMVETIVDCGKALEEYLNQYVTSGEEVEVREIFARFTTNCVASVAFGLDIDCIQNPKHEFREKGRIFFEPFFRCMIRFYIPFISPFLTKFLRIRYVDKDVEDFMIEIVRQNLKYREENRIERRDFFQLLIQIRNGGKLQDDIDDWNLNALSKEKYLSLNELAAQAFIFLVAGYESSASTMSFSLFELAKNPSIQKKVTDEIDSTLKRHNGKLNYESLSEMKYLDKCIDETLRMHPPFDVIFRECTKDYKIADTNIIIEKGTQLFFSITAPHYYSQFYDRPDKFVPGRFTDDQLSNKNSVNMPYLTFGDGPRNCIGLRLGKLQAKIGICLLLRKFSFELGTQHKNNAFILDPKSPVRAPVDGIELKVMARQPA